MTQDWIQGQRELNKTVISPKPQYSEECGCHSHRPGSTERYVGNPSSRRGKRSLNSFITDVVKRFLGIFSLSPGEMRQWRFNGVIFRRLISVRKPSCADVSFGRRETENHVRSSCREAEVLHTTGEEQNEIQTSPKITLRTSEWSSTDRLEKTQLCYIQEQKWEAVVFLLLFFFFINNTENCSSVPREVSLLLLEQRLRIHYTGKILVMSSRSGSDKF